MTASVSDDVLADRRRERNRLVEAHTHVVEHFARRYSRRGVDTEDLRQIAFLALVEAGERFDPSLDVKFATFASRTIDGTLKRHFRDRTWLVRPPRGLQELHLRVRRANEELTQSFGRHPTVDELAQHLEVEVDDIHHALEAAVAHNGVSIDSPHPGGEDEAMGDPSWIGQTEEGYGLAEARVVAEKILADLSPAERELLDLRFVDQLSQNEIATIYGISQSYASRKVRHVLADIAAKQGELDAV